MVEKINRNQTRKIIKVASTVLFILFILGYTGYEIRKLVTGPKIMIAYPQNGATVSDALLEISGMAENIRDIRLNDRKIFTDEEGNFKEKLLLSYGYNAIEVKAEDRFGKETDKLIEIIYK